MIVLVLLTGLAWWSGAAVARRAYREHASERALASMLIAFGEVVFVIQVLGWSGQLTRLNLALGSAGCSLLVAGAALGRSSWRDGARASLREVSAQVALPFVAIHEAWRARSGIGIGLVATAALLAWTTLLSWLAPSGAWDGLWYHEPMVGFALQHHGFELVEVPGHLEWVNGYPRTSEHLMLWLTAFSDRTLIDWTQQLVSPMALLSVYVLARRANGGWRLGAAGVAVTLWTIPGVVLQMRSTYVDVTVLACFMSVLVFLTRPGFRLADLWMTCLSLGLLGGTKASMIFYASAMGAALLIATLALVRRHGWMPILGHALLGLGLIAVLMAPSYVRNWVLHQNPIWPLHYEVAGIVFEGPGDLSDMQWPVEDVARELWGAPVPGQDYHDTKRHSFGYSLSFVGLPLFVLAFLLLIGRTVSGPGRRGLIGLWAVQAYGWLTLALSPAFYWARYALPAAAAGLIAGAWVLAQWKAHRLAEGLITTMIVLNLITLLWAEPAWDVSFDLAREMLQMSEQERVATRTSHNLPPEDIVQWRTQHIHAGDVVVLGTRVTFVANLWNETMTNDVVFVPPHGDARSYVERVEATGAKAAVVHGRTIEARALRQAPRWTVVGPGPYETLWFARIQ